MVKIDFFIYFICSVIYSAYIYAHIVKNIFKVC